MQLVQLLLLELGLLHRGRGRLEVLTNLVEQLLLLELLDHLGTVLEKGLQHVSLPANRRGTPVGRGLLLEELSQ